MSLLDIGLQFVSRKIYLPWSDEPWQFSANARLLLVGVLVIGVAIWNERTESADRCDLSASPAAIRYTEICIPADTPCSARCAMTDAIQVVTSRRQPGRGRQDRRGAGRARRLAACVQVSGPITSTYRWQGKVETSQEWLCTIKTRQSHYRRGGGGHSRAALLRSARDSGHRRRRRAPRLSGLAGRASWPILPVRARREGRCHDVLVLRHAFTPSRRAATAGADDRLGGRTLSTLQVAPEELATTTMPCSFETAVERLSKLERMFCEADGSFVWVSSQGEPAWQVDGNLYDRNERLLFVDLKGTCPSEQFDRLLTALGWPQRR